MPLHTHDSTIIENKVVIDPATSLQNICSLSLYEFSYCPEVCHKFGSDTIQGHVSQEVQQVYPQYCCKNYQEIDAKGNQVFEGYLAHNTTHLLYESMNAIKALQLQVAELTAKLQTLTP